MSISISPKLAAFFDPTTPEAQAHARVNDADHMWDYVLSPNHALDEQLLALAAAYVAVNRYVEGKDLYFLPSNRAALDEILRRYITDAIHNFVAMSRAQLQPGGYLRASSVASESISAMLASQKNAEKMMALHPEPVKRGNSFKRRVADG